MLIVSFIILIFLQSPASFADAKSVEKKLIQEDVKISEKIDKAANKLDAALTGEKLTDAPNLTTITIRNQFNYQEGSPFTYTPNLDVHLNLPNLEKKLQMQFSSYSEDEESRGVNKNRLRTAPRRESPGGSFHFLQKLGEVNTEFQPRFEYRNGFQLSYILKFTSSAPTKYFIFHPETQFFARSDSGIGQFVALNFEIPIYKSFGLMLINEEQYVDRENIFSTNNGLRFYHDWNDTMSQTYSIMFESFSRPNYHLDKYTVALGFSHRLFKKILHYVLTPYLVFQRDLNFTGVPGIVVELNIIF